MLEMFGIYVEIGGSKVCGAWMNCFFFVSLSPRPLSYFNPPYVLF